MLLVSEEDEPEPILEEDWRIEGQMHKYFSLVAPEPIEHVLYHGCKLPGHQKLPLVFNFSEFANELIIVRRTGDAKQKSGHTESQSAAEEIKPIVLPNTNLINRELKQ